jgi:hypothetical protein
MELDTCSSLRRNRSKSSMLVPGQPDWFSPTIHFWSSRRSSATTIARSKTATLNCSVSYGYHYQRPHDRYYFRFDHHPEVGVDFLHPEFHVHSRGRQETDRQLPA